MDNLLSEYPIDWVEKRVDELFSIQQGKQVSKKNRQGDNQRPFLRTKNVFWGKLDLAELDFMHFSEQEENRLSLEYGDLLTCEGGDIGRTTIWKNQIEKCYYQNHLHRLRFIDGSIDPEYALYWFWYGFKIGKIYFGRGNITTIPNLSKSRLSELPILKPPITEQQKISHILSTIQSAIEKQESIIKTTTELKKALMQKLFTEGLKGQPQKETEIGLLPESWDVDNIDNIADITSGGTPSRKVPEYWENGTIPWIKTGEVNYEIIKNSEEKITKKGLENSSAKLFPKGTLLIAMYGQGITRGKVGILGLDAATNQACAAIFPKDRTKILTEFLYYYFQYSYENLRNLGHGANQKNLSANIIKTFNIPIPSITEQEQIIQIFSILRNKIQTANKKKKILNDLFKSMLHNLMTGQKRVNNIKFDNIQET